MKKLLIIAVLFFSCAEERIEPVYNISQTTFDKKSVVVNDRELIAFNLEGEGVYDMVVVDDMSGDIVTRERFNGSKGLNSLYIYTHSINKGSYHLRLMDNDKVIDVLNIKL